MDYVGWDKIKGRILSALEYIRQQKLERDMQFCFSNRIRHFQQIVHTAFSDVPKPRIPVPIHEILHAEPFYDILISYAGLGTRSFTDEMRQQLQIPGLAERVIEITNAWRNAADKHLLGLLSPGLITMAKDLDQAVDKTSLELATTFFTCHWCPEALSYPRVLVHSCFLNKGLGKASNKTLLVGPHDEDAEEAEDVEEEDDDVSNHESELKENYGIVKATPLVTWNSIHVENGRRWNESGNEIAFDDEASGAAKRILQAIGEDPATMNATQIQAMDIRVECMRCSTANSTRRGRPRIFMTWNMAVINILLGLWKSYYSLTYVGSKDCP